MDLLARLVSWLTPTPPKPTFKPEPAPECPGPKGKHDWKTILYNVKAASPDGDKKDFAVGAVQNCIHCGETNLCGATIMGKA